MPLRNPKSKVGAAEDVAPAIAAHLPYLPQDPEQLVRINGAVQVGAGTLLALGRFPAAVLDLAGRQRDPDDSRRTPLLGDRGRPDQARPAADPLLQEPRPARRPDARGRRHRGPSGAGLAGAARGPPRGGRLPRTRARWPGSRPGSRPAARETGCPSERCAAGWSSYAALPSVACSRPGRHRSPHAPVRATVAVPGSKSMTNRALVLAALAQTPTTIRGPAAQP